MGRPQAKNSNRASTSNSNSKRNNDSSNNGVDVDGLDESRGGRDDADNGFAQWGGYMAAKKQKLDKQFHQSNDGIVEGKSLRSRASGNLVPQIFKGITIYISGYTNPPEPELRELFTNRGGRYDQWPNASTTFVVATNLAAAKKKMYAKRTLKPEWITDSINEGQMLDHRPYLLYNLNKENKQQTLTQAIKIIPKPNTETTETENVADRSVSTTPSPTTSPEVRDLKMKKLTIKIPKIDQGGQGPPKLDKSQSQSSRSDSNATSTSKKTDAKSDVPVPVTPSVTACEPMPISTDLSSGLGDSQPASAPESLLIDVNVTPSTPTTSESSSKLAPTNKVFNHDEPVDDGHVTAFPDGDSDDSEEVTIIESTPSPPLRSRPRPCPRSRQYLPGPVGKALISKPTSAAPEPEPEPKSLIPDDETISNSSLSTSGLTTSMPNAAPGKMKTAAEEGFLQEFYNNSRLHLIATLKKERQRDVGEWRANMASHKFHLAEKYQSLLLQKQDFTNNDNSKPTSTVLFHIDLDCFFVAVARLSRPHLIGKPVVITHSKTTAADSKSDIACASYEARELGISAGMWVYQAKERCPDVVAIPYDFDEYSRVSKQFYETVASLTLEMEAISCDEMLVNVTKLLQQSEGVGASDPVRLAKFLIEEIQEATGVKASIGIGANRLLTKFATRTAKDAKTGCHLMTLSDAQAYIREKPVGKLPGVGWATVEKLETLGVKTGADLEKMSLQELKREFGDKTGQKLHSVCRGIDDDTVNVDCGKAKSISAGCSFGVRFANMMECERFLKEVAEEAANRAAAARCYCNRMTLTLWIARKGYEKETVKPGGHGVADVHNKSQAFKQRTREPSILNASTLELARGIMRGVVPPEHVRGVSISLDGLVYEEDLTEKEKKSHQPTLFSQIKRISANKPPEQEPAVLDSVLPSIPGPSKSVEPQPHAGTSANPYNEIQQLDASYLAALPDDVRAEVELEFQKAKYKKAGPGAAGSSKPGPACSKLSPIRRQGKKSPLKGRKKGSPGKAGRQLKFSPRKQSSSGSAGGGNNLHSYFKSVSRSKSPSSSPIKCPGGAKNSPMTSTQIPGLVEVLKPNFTLDSNENRLTVTPSSSELARPIASPEMPEEMDQELQILLKTTPSKKSPLEMEQMVLSFTEESESTSNENGNRNKIGSRVASTDNECGQRFLLSGSSRPCPKSKRRPSAAVAEVLEPQPTTSTGTGRVRNISEGEDDPRIQAAILKSLGKSNGEEDGVDFDDGFDFRWAGSPPAADNLSVATNRDLSDREDDLAEYDIDLNNLRTPPESENEEDDDVDKPFVMELPPLNGKHDIDEVHATIRVGINNRLPSESDKHYLTAYFKELSGSFLTQTCNSLRFLQSLSMELKQKGGKGAREWIELFESLVKQSKEWIVEAFGGAFEV